MKCRCRVRTTRHRTNVGSRRRGTHVHAFHGDVGTVQGFVCHSRNSHRIAERRHRDGGEHEKGNQPKGKRTLFHATFLP